MAPSSGESPLFLKGVHAYFLGLSSKIAAAARQAVEAQGGKIIPPRAKIPPMFQKAKAAADNVGKSLPQGVTHVLCDPDICRQSSPDSILQALDVQGPLPSSVVLVRLPWLSECLRLGHRVDTGPYEVDMNAAPTRLPEDGLTPGPGVTGKHKTCPDEATQGTEEDEGATAPRHKRPRIVIRQDATLPPAPPLLESRDPPRRLSFPFVPPNQIWSLHDLGLLHLRVQNADTEAPRPAMAPREAAVMPPSLTSPASPIASSPASLPRPAAPSPPSLPDARSGPISPATPRAQTSSVSAPPVRIAAFDLDSTLIKTRSESAFASSPTDWQWFAPSVPASLRSLHEQGYKIVIVSNQRGIESKKTDLSSLLQRLSSVVDALHLPGLEGFFATHTNVFYKPAPGSWYLLEERYPEGIDVSRSFFVGDAAGRPKQGPFRPRDHGDGDLKFAVNVGIAFQTPEECFHKSRSPRDAGAEAMERLRRAWVSPVRGYLREAGMGGSEAVIAACTSRSILLVGAPASGKSMFCRTTLPHHTRVNQDTLKTLGKCRQAAAQALGEGHSIVIDATNARKELRKDWARFLRECPLSAPPSSPASSSSSSPSPKASMPSLLLKLVEFLPPKSAVLHLNAFRGVNLDGARRTSEAPRRVPDVVIHSYYKNAQPVGEAWKEEGFDAHSVVKELVLERFQNRREAHLFGCFLPAGGR
ncbi:hypothetical protein NSK_003928 [Nannochloropsis salina CCMP1776]|uniref:BRCT domain-containing protein n=1 Tax=Nannochloropsis salina CCMP1776 TaxID=1027361 RepID=A0A4D9D0L3_9STRA|nr:hypothetical protein NSK_003928 [Nannochloropsis salina CCMP1776]|eukprot:TFJ84896.1 hypothetical protein NSK_003928 [Nannochloropsis salina CCMP1776]